MKQIILESMRLQNFKTFHKPTSIYLTPESGLKFLGGKNFLEPRLGSNGASKSSIWDALCWCLFGLGVRGQKASELKTWDEKKPPQVSVILLIDGVAFCIERWGSPNKLCIENKVASQDDVETLIGLDRERFLQSVLFGQDVSQFLDINVAGRGELLQAVCRLQLWEDLSEAASRQSTVLSRQIADLDKALAFENGRWAALPDADELHHKASSWRDKQRLDMDGYILQIERLEKEINTLERDEKEAALALKKLPNLDEIDEDLREATKRYDHVKQLENQLNYFERNKNCPTCKQPLNSIHCIMDLEDELKKWESLESQTKLLDDLKEEKLFLINRNKFLSEQVRNAKADIRARLSHIDMLVESVERINSEHNPYTAQLSDLKRIKDEIDEKIAEITTDTMRLKGELAKTEFWKSGFKKVRLYQTKQILLRLEVETANAASALGLPNWQIKYVTEVETKSGTLKQGIQVLIETPNYKGRIEGFSGGETQRIRLAVTIGLATLIQNMAGVNYNFEIWDEPSKYLSVEGVEDLLNCLANRAEMTKKSIWLCDHTNQSFGGFSEIWQAVKDHDGSRVELLSRSN